MQNPLTGISGGYRTVILAVNIPTTQPKVLLNYQLPKEGEGLHVLGL